MINRYFFKSTLNKFIGVSQETIFGEIAMKDEGDSGAEQKYAWSEEIDIMKQVLQPWKDEYELRPGGFGLHDASGP